MTPFLIHEPLFHSAQRSPEATALAYQAREMSFADTAQAVRQAGAGLLGLGLKRGDRVAVYLEKRFETIAAMFGAAAAGGVFVPVNPLLKAEQVGYILRDCNVRVLVTSPDRYAALAASLADCPDIHAVVLTGPVPETPPPPVGVALLGWEALSQSEGRAPHRVIGSDMAAILYTSGSTGKPKGVVISHLNMLTGAQSVSQYLSIAPEDRLLSVLPLSFDYGLNQITTAFLTGARAVLLNFLLPRDIVSAVAKHGITGLAAVPPLWVQVAALEWPQAAVDSLRYITNSGGKMPKATLELLRAKLPKTQPFLMYGLTEAFRSTYLPPAELDRRPDSMGKAIPNAEIMVVREDGSPCAPGEPGELVHRGPLVSLGYWNDPDKTAERFKPVPAQPGGLVLTEMAVWSGDTVMADEEGFLYFVGRRDEMIKTSGYRVSPTEVEEVIYASGLVGDAAAMGIEHPTLGQAIVVVVTPKAGELTPEAVSEECRKRLPAFMVPTRVLVREGSLPRNPNGKIDRKLLSTELADLFEGAA